MGLAVPCSLVCKGNDQKTKTKLMKLLKQLVALAIGATAATQGVHASLTFGSGFGGNVFHTHSTADSVVSFDWAGGDFYTMTSAGFPDVNVWRHSGSGTTNIHAAPSNFAGASVLAIGDYVYFNDSTTENVQNIWKYGPLSGTPAASVTSTTPNSGLYSNQGDLFITGAIGFGTNEIFRSALDGNGDLVTDPATSLGTTFGGSGPIIFDGAGNLFYAPGFSDKRIFRWTAAQVQAAIADPINNPLPTTGVEWYDYSDDFDVSGATGMILDANGNLVISLTDFSNPSFLVEFGVDPFGDHSGHTVIATSTSRLGDVRFYDGSVYFASGNEVFQVIPEPAHFAFAGGVLVLLLVVYRSRRGRMIGRSVGEKASPGA